MGNQHRKIQWKNHRKKKYWYQNRDSRNRKNNFIHFRLYSNEYLSYYEFFGKVLAKAIFDKITINANFNVVFLKQLLEIPLSIEDLKYLDFAYYSSLKSILETENFVNNSELTMTWNVRNGEIIEDVELVSNGRNILISHFYSIIYLNNNF